MKNKFFLSLSLILAFGTYAVFWQMKDYYLVKGQNSELGRGSTSSGSTVPTATSGITTSSQGMYANGIYAGDVTDAYYGNVQISATITSGKISAIKFLDYPQDRTTSKRISDQSMPILINEAIVSQSANVDIVSGATQTSIAFRASLASALARAKK